MRRSMCVSSAEGVRPREVVSLKWQGWMEVERERGRATAEIIEGLKNYVQLVFTRHAQNMPYGVFFFFPPVLLFKLIIIILIIIIMELFGRKRRRAQTFLIPSHSPKLGRSRKIHCSLRWNGLSKQRAPNIKIIRFLSSFPSWKFPSLLANGRRKKMGKKCRHIRGRRSTCFVLFWCKGLIRFLLGYSCGEAVEWEKSKALTKLCKLYRSSIFSLRFLRT